MVDRSSGGGASDPLAPVFANLRLRGLVLATVELSPPWGFRAAGFDDVAFYVAGGGGAYVDHRQTRAAMAAGDMVIVAPRTPHTLRDHPLSPVVPLQLLEARTRHSAERARAGAKRGATTLLLGCFRFNNAQRDLLLSCLPRVIHLRAVDAEARRLHVMQALAAEMAGDGMCGDAVQIRLAEALFIQVLRACVNGSAPARGWLRALGDPQLCRALTAFHLAPQKRWTVEALAAMAGTSRSVFAAHFTETVGQPPLRYIMAWRIRLAATLLEDESLGMKQIAARVGYGSDQSFSRAFGQVMGTTPGAYRATIRSPRE